MTMFAEIDLLGKALDGALLRKSAISQNLSNVNTPNYKRKDVDFESTLAKALEKKSISEINLDDLEPTMYIDRKTTAYRMDGNNVDVDTEMAQEAKVKMRYDALVTRVNGQFSRFNTVLQNLK